MFVTTHQIQYFHEGMHIMTPNILKEFNANN